MKLRPTWRLQGALAVAASLLENDTLEKLDLRSNHLGPDVGSAFAQLLRGNKGLKVSC